MRPTVFDVSKGHNVPLGHEPFRLGIYQMVEEQDDFLICKGYDPNGQLSAPQKINIAKPYRMQKTPWDGQSEMLYVDGELAQVTYEYKELGLRIARATLVGDDGEDEEVEEYQRITMDYRPGDYIIAVQVRKNVVLDGTPFDSNSDPLEWSIATGAISANAKLTWVDLNWDGRCWAESPGDVPEE